MLAAIPAIAAPGNGNGNAYGRNKVCVLTFDDSGQRNNVNVVDARLMPLPAARNAQSRDSDNVGLYTYGTDAPDYDGVTNIPSPSGTDITSDMNTEQVCNVLAEQAAD
jgi:hypothetical protein